MGCEILQQYFVSSSVVACWDDIFSRCPLRWRYVRHGGASAWGYVPGSCDWIYADLEKANRLNAGRACNSCRKVTVGGAMAEFQWLGESVEFR